MEAQAAAEHTTERALLERLVAEGLDILHHPGIVFRDGPAGRRAALEVGPGVWDVVSALRYTTGTHEQRVGMLAEQFDRARVLDARAGWASTRNEIQLGR